MHFTADRIARRLMDEVHSWGASDVSAEIHSPINYRSAIESRPPAQTWQPRLAPLMDEAQPMLDLYVRSTGHANAGGAVWMAAPRPGLPDATAWSSSLAKLLIETVQGLRPIGQLNRWVDERVLAAISSHRRQRLRRNRHPQTTRPAVLRSVHVQFPVETAAEVAVHLLLSERSVALAFRLEDFYGRWLCTAVELGPH
jgi:Family of unknown function (DUF6459)